LPIVVAYLTVLIGVSWCMLGQSILVPPVAVMGILS
jgi:hypothetical protein